MKRWLIALAAAILVLSGCATNSVEYELMHHTDLTVTIVDLSNKTQDRYQLGCDPATGDHPDAERACLQIYSLSPSMMSSIMPPTSDHCPATEVEHPYSAQIDGTYQGKPVYLTFAMNNECQIKYWSYFDEVLMVDNPGGSATT